MGGKEHDLAEYFQCLAGIENDLNHILSTFVESEHDIENVCDSRCIELANLTSIIKDGGNDFTIRILNVQSIKAKFDNLYLVINNLSSIVLYLDKSCENIHTSMHLLAYAVFSIYFTMNINTEIQLNICRRLLWHSIAWWQAIHIFTKNYIHQTTHNLITSVSLSYNINAIVAQSGKRKPFMLLKFW